MVIGTGVGKERGNENDSGALTPRVGGERHGSWDTHIPVVSNSLIYLVWGFLSLPSCSSFIIFPRGAGEAQEEEAAKGTKRRQRGRPKASWVRVQM